MAKFQMGVTLDLRPSETARVGDGAAGVNVLTRLDAGKFGKLIGDSQYGLCAVGDKIEGVIATADDMAPQDGFNLGTVRKGDRVKVKFEGSQAAGTGSIAIGDFVVAGTPDARGVALVVAPKVRKATNQPGAVPADLTAAGDQAKVAIWAWRVISILSGTGAVGDVGVIERV